MVEGYWNIDDSQLVTSDEKLRIKAKLYNKINAAGFLLVKSQKERSQLGNKQQVIKKMNLLTSRALEVYKKRTPTRPTKRSKQERLESKKKNAVLKQDRKK